MTRIRQLEIEVPKDDLMDSITPSDRERERNYGKELPETLCRICMDVESQENPLISPCRCSGSVKFVHEECMKTWLVSLQQDLSRAQCELCKTALNMKLEVKTNISCKDVCAQSLAHFIFAPLLISVLAMLLLIIYLLGERYADSDNSSSEKAYTMSLIVACGIAVIVILVLVVQSCRETCVRSQIGTWKILPQVFPEQNKTSLSAERTIINAGHPDSSLLVLPDKVRVGRKKIPIPELKPVSMTPLCRNGNIVAFQGRPGCFSLHATPHLNQPESISFDRVVFQHEEAKVAPRGF